MKRFGTPANVDATPDQAGAPIGAAPIPIELNDKVFHVRGNMSGIKLLRVIKAMDGGDDDANVGGVIWDFLEFAFLKEEREEAMEYLENADPAINFNDLMEIIQWLVEQYTGNPTESPSPSATGSGEAGSGATETPSSEGATLEPLTPTPSGQ